MNKKVLLLDADSLIYICAVKETFQDCKDEFDSRFKIILESTEATSYIGFLTNSGCFRYKISATYKANRKTSIPPKYFKAIKEYAIAEYGFRGFDRLEADDLVGIAKTYYDKEKTSNIIAAIDKDVLKQIPGLHFNYSFDKETEVMKGFVETSERNALQFLFQQSLSGDSGDNIKGLPGIGEKKAIDFLEATQAEEFTSYYTDCLKLYCLKLGIKQGVVALSESYRLVRILRTVEEVQQEIYITEGIDINAMALNFSEWEISNSKVVEW